MTEPFRFTNGQLAYNADDLIKLCEQFPADGIQYLMREDLEKWLTYIGKTELAQYATDARQASLDARQKLAKFIDQCKTQSKTPTKVTSEAASAVGTEVVSQNKPSFFKAVAKAIIKIFVKDRPREERERLQTAKD